MALTMSTEDSADQLCRIVCCDAGDASSEQLRAQKSWCAPPKEHQKSDALLASFTVLEGAAAVGAGAGAANAKTAAKAVRASSPARRSISTVCMYSGQCRGPASRSRQKPRPDRCKGKAKGREASQRAAR